MTKLLFGWSLNDSYLRLAYIRQAPDGSHRQE